MTGNNTQFSRRNVLKGTGAVGVAGLAGCLGGSDDSSGDSKATDNPLEMLHAWTGGDGKKAVNALTAAFEEEYPDMKTDFRPIGGGGNENLDAVVAKRLSNNNPPSSFAGWPGKNLVKYEGVLADGKESVWEEDGLMDAHVEEAKSLCQYDGKWAAVPIGSHRMNNLFYNPNVLDEAGVDANSLGSVEDLIAAMKKVGENTDAVPMAQGMKGSWTTLQLWAVVMLAQEGYDAYMNYVEGDGKEAPVRRTFETVKEILTNYINEDASSIGFTTANQKIMNGEAAFIHQGNWAAGAYKSNDLKYNEDWGWVAFPGTEDMYGLHIDAFIYPSDNPSPVKTKKWLRFVGSKKAQIAFNKWKGSIPTRDDIATDEFGDYLTETIEDFGSAKHRPPTLAHGLAVEPETLTSLKGVISKHFSGPFDVDAATTAMLENVE